MFTNIGYLGVELIQTLIGYLPFQTKDGRLQTGKRFTFRNFRNTFFAGDGKLIAGILFRGNVGDGSFLIDLILENPEFTDIRFQQCGNSISGNFFR